MPDLFRPLLGVVVTTPGQPRHAQRPPRHEHSVAIEPQHSPTACRVH
jgi:hypothetical protein